MEDPAINNQSLRRCLRLQIGKVLQFPDRTRAILGRKEKQYLARSTGFDVQRRDASKLFVKIKSEVDGMVKGTALSKRN